MVPAPKRHDEALESRLGQPAAASLPPWRSRFTHGARLGQPLFDATAPSPRPLPRKVVRLITMRVAGEREATIETQMRREPDQCEFVARSTCCRYAVPRRVGTP